MNLARVKAKYGCKVCIIGNIDSSRTLPFGTPDQIEAETLEALRIAAPGYGYILASDHSLHDGIPVNNILLMFDCARRHGVYFGENLAA
jgi:uroporphyrinogen decarboxylase